MAAATAGREDARRWAEARPTLRLGRRHSRFVGAMKLVLPALAAALIGIVLAWPGAFDGSQPLPLAFSTSGGGPAGQLAMTNPRFVGTDKDGDPFMITAESASQDPADLRRITLHGLQADLTLDNGTWLSLIAKGGFYHQGQQSLRLDGPVSVYSDLGYEFHAGDVAVDLTLGTAATETPVEGHGPFGSIRADRMRITGRGERLSFRDHVSVTLNPGREH